MAYTIISQNNTTTTLADENGNVITVPARVTLATSTDYTITKVNNNSVDLVDGNGKVIRGVPACVVLAGEGGGGGGSVDYAKTVQRATTMPVASADNAGQQFLYAGATDATYTHDYIYESVATTTYSSTVTFEAATLSSSTIACSGDDFAAFVAEWGSGDITTITNGTITYDQSGGLLVFVGKDAEDTTVCTFQLYTQDYEDAGFTITGTLQDGDVFAFTTSITATTSYAWTRVDVQPTPEALPDQTGQNGKFLTTNGTTASWGTVESLPSQTGQSGKFLTTDGTDASWSDKPLVNKATGSDSLTILGSGASAANSINIGAGSSIYVYGKGIAVGPNCKITDGNGSIAVGWGAVVNADSAIQIAANNSGYSFTNSETGTVKIALLNSSYQMTNYKVLDRDGTVPHARLTNAVVSNTITIAAADWNGGTTCTKTVSGLTATSTVWVAPAGASMSDYTSAGIYASAQAADSLTFTCTTTPTSAIDVVVTYC